MKTSDSKIEFAFVKENVVVDDKVLFFKGSRISAKAVRECYQRYGIKIEVVCSCGAAIQTRSYIKKSPRKTVYFCLKPGADHATKECGYIKSQLPYEASSTLLSSHKAPTYFKFLSSNTQTSTKDETNTLISLADDDHDHPTDVGTNLTYHIRSICQYYLEILAATKNDLDQRREILRTCELTTPHHLSINYQRLFKSIDAQATNKIGTHHIYFGRIEKIIHCRDGAIIELHQVQRKHRCLVLLRNKHLNQFKRWQKIYQTIREEKLNTYPWLFVYGAIEQSFNSSFIDARQHGCLSFMQHPLDDNKPFWHEHSESSIDAHIGRGFKNQFSLHKSADDFVLKTEIEQNNFDNTMPFMHRLTLPETLRKQHLNPILTTSRSRETKPLVEHLQYNLDFSDETAKFIGCEIEQLDESYKAQRLPLKPEDVSFPVAPSAAAGVLSYVRRMINKWF